MEKRDRMLGNLRSKTSTQHVNRNKELASLHEQVTSLGLQNERIKSENESMNKIISKYNKALNEDIFKRDDDIAILESTNADL